MESNGNQRKRGGRNTKNVSANVKSLQNVDHNEVMEVSALAISPTMEESETVNNAPASECRRSSRKKIIKFDVRDLLNKNRKTHKIQIEARIDSNAPTTSKSATSCGVATSSSKTSLSASREDLISKHKTFLEKSAIFRRYSVSQEHKAPLPPMPIPPLLGKGNEHKDSNFSGTSNCQEFLSHAMIKPKEPTSLIVAQIESNKPSSAAAMKRKNMYKSTATGKKNLANYETAPILQPKKRGRPTKVKAQPSVEHLMLSSKQNEKKITPEKARNWKEYKACVTQQSGSNPEGSQVTKQVDKAIIISKHGKDVSHIVYDKQDEDKNFEDTLQSDISRSDDDGNFSGFQNNKDDVTCDSPILENKGFVANINIKNTINSPISIENTSKEAATIFECVENKSSCKSNQMKPSLEIAINENNKNESYSTRTPSEVNSVLLGDICKQDLDVEILKTKKSETGNIGKEECKITKQTISLKENLNNKKHQLNIEFINQNNSTENEKDTCKSERNCRTVTPLHYEHCTITDEYQAVQKLKGVSKETGIITSTPLKQEIPNTTENIKNNKVEQINPETPKVSLEIEKRSKKHELGRDASCEEPLQSFHVPHENPRDLNTINICAKAFEIKAECPTQTKVIKNRELLSQPSSSSDEIKSFSRTSSSSESENASERGSYSSEPFSSASSASTRSYKSGDKLKVSVKRILLPKSPSTSSQTSTSEEFNKANLIRRKPPMGKRSKRIQKKSIDDLFSQKGTENIVNSFQIILNENKPESELINIIDNEKEVEGNELTKTVHSESVTANTKRFTASCIDTETTDTLSNESSNVKAKIVKRKSLRHRKDNISCNKVVETNKSIFKGIEKPSESMFASEQCTFTIEHAPMQEILPNETEVDKEQTFNKQKKKTAGDDGSNQIYKFENKINIKEHGGHQTTTVPNEKLVITPSDNKEITKNEQTIIEVKDIDTVNSINLTNTEKEVNVFQLSAVIEKTNHENTVDVVVSEKLSKATENIQSTAQIVFQHENEQKVGPILGKVSVGITSNTVVNKDEKVSNKNETQINEENLNISESEMCKMNRNQQTSSEIEVDKQTISDVLQLKAREDTTIPPKKKSISLDKEKVDKFASTIEESALASKTAIQIDKNIGDELNSSKISEHTLQFCRKKSGTEDQSKPKTVTELTASESVPDTTCHAKTFTTAKENVGINQGKNSNKNTLSTNRIVKQIIVTENIEMLKENDKNVKDISTDPKNDSTIPKAINAKQLYSTQEEARTFSEKLNSITKYVDVDKSEKVISTRNSSNKIENSTKESSNKVTLTTHDAIQLDVLRETLKDDFTFRKDISQSQVHKGDNLAVVLLKANLDKETENSPQKRSEQSSDESVLLAAHKTDVTSDIPLTKRKTAKEENSSNNSKKGVSKKNFNSSTLLTSSGDNFQTCTAELYELGSSTKDIRKKIKDNSECLKDANLLCDNLKKEQTLGPLSLITSSADLNKPSQHSDLVDKPQKIELIHKVELIKETYNSNVKQETVLQERNEKSVIVPVVTKRRVRKSRFKNLHGPEIDSESDSSNGKSTPIGEPNHQKKDMETKMSTKEQLEGTEIEKEQTFPKTNGNECNEIERNGEDDTGNKAVARQENAQGNLLSSQIKNVSIETNTLLDILRTVQSNTEAALKANKSPIKIDIMSKEPSIAGCSKIEFDKNFQDLQKPDEQEHKTTSPILFETEFSLTVKKLNLSPARSESGSPSILKKVTPSPTRSTSSSPLTLKKVTRRYERRSRRAEDCAHKTLEETFAEIAEQSSKAVLAAKEFDINEEQTKNDNKLEKELEVNSSSNFPNEDLEENFLEIEKKKTNPGEMPPNNEKQVVESVLNMTQNLSMTPADSQDLNPGGIPVEVETAKVTPTRKNRKKILPLEQSMIEEKEIMGTSNSGINRESSDAITEIVKENKMLSETEETAMLPKLNDSPETASVEDLSTKNSENCTPLLSEPHDDSKYSHILSETVAEGSLKELDMSECKLSKKNKKADAREYSECDATDISPDKEESRTSKMQMKKLDSFLNKTEVKLVCQKIQKKTKNEEDDSPNLQKEETLVKIETTTSTPSKRGRKPKQQQHETLQTISKKKNKKDICVKNDDNNLENLKVLDSESDSLNSLAEKSLDEKVAKKKRQKKLKEAFEAALTDDNEKLGEISETTICDTSANNFNLALFSNSPRPSLGRSISNEDINESIKFTCLTPVDTEADLDPLKDIEKFIADGVNLLKKDYKLDEDSVNDVMQSTPDKATKTVGEPIKTTNEETKHIFNTFETPVDTPINTPSATPPPKSPTSIEFNPDETSSGVRRSHRIKLITKTPKALVGRGLVRDRERFSIKDDVETKSHYTMDDHLTDLAEVEAKNAKFLKEMEERLSNFQVIKENDYLCERVISREAKKMICDCFLTHEEEGRGELGCGEDCLNRLLMIECGPECNVKERCTNKRFQKLLCSPCRVFRTEKKGFGIMADIEILPGEFIMEYVGEVIDTEEFEKRRLMYSQDKNRHYYFMALRSDAIIDATIKGNISRFINHSCDPNAETQKWTVNGELRIGFFSRKSIMPGEEITFNYQYQRYGREAQRCYCESANCTGWIGQEPTSDEGEQMDDEYDESEDEEEADSSNLLVQDDDDDSDASVADPEEVQKQLEMAAAQAEVELAPLQLLQEKVKQVEATLSEGKSLQDLNKSDNEEDSKSKFKKLLSKMAEKVAAKQKQNKREQKLRRKKKSKESSAELANKLRFLEDPDIEDEVEFLKECGLKNQSDTLRLSRLMVRAKLVQTRLNLLEILRKGDFPCRRLFLDYHGLRLLHGWMSEDAGNMQIRMSLLQTLETLPIANKTVLTDSKVMHAVRTWSGTGMNISPNEDSSSSNSNSQDTPVQSSTTLGESSEMAELQKLALKLITTWEGLPEIFRIPKKERIEQMKEHEREADRQYAANVETEEINTVADRFRRDRFGRGLNSANTTSSTSNRFFKPNNGNPHKTANTKPENVKILSKAERREMFAARVARAETEKRLAEERREFETKCRFFGLDPKKTRAQDIPFCVNPATGQWFSIERKPIVTPPSYAHVQVPVKLKSTDPKDYQLPAVCSSLPSQWKYALTPQGKIYYYHIKQRISQWEPPTPIQLQQCEMEAWEDDSESEISTTAGEDSSDDDDDVLIGMDTTQLKAYIDRRVEMRRQKRYQRLVDQRSISPRREEDRIYNQIEVRKYKENKEKIRKRKEDIRRRRAEALRQTALNMCTLGSITDSNPITNKSNIENNEELGALPIQDYLLSSDEEIDLKAEINSPLIDKIVEGDKIVDELEALTNKKQLKRPLPPHRDFNEPSTSTSIAISSIIAAKQEYKKRKLEKKEKRKPKEQDAKYRKNKEKFRCEIAGIIVHHLKPYIKETCTLGRIQSNEDFNHLARKLTHFVMIKELKYCESVGQTLVVTESVKSKSREFIKKYMAKYGDVYIKPTNDPDFKDIPFTL